MRRPHAFRWIPKVPDSNTVGDSFRQFVVYWLWWRFEAEVWFTEEYAARREHRRIHDEGKWPNLHTEEDFEKCRSFPCRHFRKSKASE